MDKNQNSSGLRRSKAVGIGTLIPYFLRSMGLSYGMNTHIIYCAWDAVSGAGPFTLKTFFRNGTLFVTLNSSVIRSQLYMQKDVLVEKINQYLAGDHLYDEKIAKTGYVQKIVLK
ncbi:MAG: DciA family protein [Bacteroidales bacterium]